MRDTRDELREELMAVLAASRELPADASADLANAFLDRLAHNNPGPAGRADYWRVPKRAVFIAVVGIIWATVAAILAAVPWYYYIDNRDVPGSYFQTVPVILMLAVALSVIVYVVDANRRRLLHIRILIVPRQESS